MATKIHDGKWDNVQAIDPLTSLDQHFPLGYTGVRSFLGIDTEMLVKEEGKIIWPWQRGLPQEREPKNPLTNDLRGLFDFHGDGYITELCTVPAHCLEIMNRNIGYGFCWLGANALAGMLKVTVSAPAIYDIPEEIEKEAPEQAKRLGCMPSNNVYGDAGIPGSLPPNKRTTGCHLHISHPVLKTEDICVALVKWADILVGCTWTYISPNPSSVEAARRKAYGRAGEYRLKKYPVFPETELISDYSYGVEYRVLPGTPIQHPAYISLMFSLYRSAMRLAATLGEPKEELVLQAKEAINSANKTEAKKVIRSLPISEGGRKLIRYLRRAPMMTKNAYDWYCLSANNTGHQRIYEKSGISGRVLSL